MELGQPFGILTHDPSLEIRLRILKQRHNSDLYNVLSSDLGFEAQSRLVNIIFYDPS